ncbi:septin-5-like isoform X1 [Argopecten irradians]|uniref:septin-5-like isoform X1 n=1 Tax=Argopecten irradians TaxID=31199 RepID=UPI003710D235
MSKSTNVKQTDVKTTNVKPTDVKSTDVKTTNVRTTNVKSTNVKPTDVKTTNVRTTNVKSTNVKPTDVKTTNVRTTNVKSTNVKPTGVKTTNVKTTDEKTPDVKTTADQTSDFSLKNSCEGEEVKSLSVSDYTEHTSSLALHNKDRSRGISILGTSKSLLQEPMTLSLDISGVEYMKDEDGKKEEKDEGLSLSMSSTSSFMRGSDDTMSDLTISPPISPFNSPAHKNTSTFVTSTPKSFIKTPNKGSELVRRNSLPLVESNFSENSSLKYSLVDIDLTNSYRQKDSKAELKSPNVTKSLSFSSGTPLAEALSLPTPSPRRKPRVSRRTSQKLIRMDDDEFIGFATLPDQVHRKAVKRGFEFGLMVVGETGLGKSTLINSLFLTDLYKDRTIPNVEDTVKKTVQIEKKQLEIEERGVKLRLTIVDTPGFNDSVNGEKNWTPIIDYIDNQFDQYYQAESGLNRKNIQDTRVHCCLYFISPYGHGLKPVDIAVMKRLHTKVNIVPLLAKSDILTPKEVKKLKAKILDEIKENHIQIYQFPECDSDEDEEFKQQDKALKAAIPFAVVGSNTVVEAGGKKIRGRMYPWGIVEVDNPKHCDFGKLRQMLISTHMQDLKDITADLHYENYRAEHLAEEMKSSQRERSKLKRDSIVNLDAVSETDRLLQQKEAEIQRMQAMLAKMQAQLQNNQSPANGKVANG